MEFQVGESLIVDGDSYNIVGKIEYRNNSDNCTWTEYKLLSQGVGIERWLSIDNTYKEYSISKVGFGVSTSGYHEVDRGTEVVVGCWGDVDVEVGDKADFVEYEDPTEEKIISTERWDDGEETSTGYYLDEDEIKYASSGMGGYSEPFAVGGGFRSAGSYGKSNFKSKSFSLIMTIVIMVVMVLPSMISMIRNLSGPAKIDKELSKSTLFTYVSSITGTGKEKANIYRASEVYTIDDTFQWIIQTIEGETEDVQKNTEDGDDSIAILTKKEYCLIYKSEEGHILVQVSPRKFNYTTDSDVYHARRGARRYYRRYYYSRGLAYDNVRYKKSNSAYSSFDDTSLGTNSSTDSYQSYSNSIRQQAIARRASEGGGLSSGK